MRTFAVYKNERTGEVASVKQGFSWPALFFGVIWMLIKKLWSRAALWIVLLIISSVLQTALERSVDFETDLGTPVILGIIGWLLVMAYSIFLWLYPAFRGNQWRVTTLLARGYTHVSTIQAPDAGAAIVSVIEQNTASMSDTRQSND